MIEDVIKRSSPNVSQSDVIDTLQASSSPQVNNETRADEFERLARETKEITSLYNLAVTVGSTLNLNQIIWRLYKESSSLIDTSNFALAFYDKNINALNFNLLVNQGKPVKPFSFKIANNQGLLAHLLTRQAPLLIQDLTRINGRAEIEEVYPTKELRAWLGAPIFNPALPDHGVQGIITLWSDKPNAFTEHDSWLLSAIGTQAANAIRNAQLYEAGQRRVREMNLVHEMSQRRATEMALLNDIARKLSSTLQFKEVLTRATEGVNKLLKVEVGFLFLTDALTGDLMFQRAWGEKAKDLKPFRIPRGKDIAGRVALTSKPLLLREADLKKHRLNELEQQLNLPVRNLLCVPLISHEQVIGVLQVINNQEGDFTQNHLELLSSIASYAAIAIENARLHQNVLDKRDLVIRAEEEARKDLARDLHDGPTQLISSVMMRLDFCKMLLEKEPAKLPGEIATTQKLAEQAIHEIRTLLFEMRPLILEAQGLGEALKIFMERRRKDVEGKTRLTLEIKSSNANGDISRQDTKVEAAIFAIVQEAVNNALKHAEAQNIAVQVKETATAIYVIIKDDGKGFDMDQVMSNYQERESWGVANIRERTQLIGAELTMKSIPGEGTHITVYVPKAIEERLKKRGTGPLSLPLDML
jgi:signal transduction histidine kinase